MKVKRATPADATRLAAAAESMFRDAFAPDNDPAQMDLYCRATFSPERQEAELRRPGAVVLMFEDDEGIAAYVQLNADAHPGTLILSQQRPLEVERFYVTKRHHGTGLATQLMQEAIAHARSINADCMWLGVWKDNKRAIAFYKKMGFDVIGEQPFMLGAEEQTDFVMARKLK